MRERAHILFGHFQIDGIFTARLADGGAHLAQRLGTGLRQRDDGRSLAFGAVDRCLLFAFRAGNVRFALTAGNIDLLLLASFRSGNQCALFALGRNLRLHRMQNLLGRRQILDFITQYLDTPIRRRFIDGIHDGRINMVALFKCLVEFHFTDHRTQGRLRQLRNGGNIIRRAIRSTHGIGNLKIQNTIDLQLRIVTRNAYLRRHVEWNFLEHVLVSDAVDERHNDIQARTQYRVELAQALHHPGMLLRHHIDRLEDKYQCQQ